MAVRRWAVRAPKENVEVDRAELVQALMDGEALLWRAGGILTVLPYRQRTGLDGEMVTTAALFEWKDRTDAQAQPETATAPPAAAAPPPAEPPAAAAPAPAPAPPAPPAPALDLTGVVGDGIDERLLPDEDLAAVEGR